MTPVCTKISKRYNKIYFFESPKIKETMSFNWIFEANKKWLQWLDQNLLVNGEKFLVDLLDLRGSFASEKRAIPNQIPKK